MYRLVAAELRAEAPVVSRLDHAYAARQTRADRTFCASSALRYGFDKRETPSGIGSLASSEASGKPELNSNFNPGRRWPARRASSKPFTPPGSDDIGRQEVDFSLRPKHLESVARVGSLKDLVPELRELLHKDAPCPPSKHGSI